MNPDMRTWGLTLINRNSSTHANPSTGSLWARFWSFPRDTSATPSTQDLSAWQGRGPAAAYDPRASFSPQRESRALFSMRLVRGLSNAPTSPVVSVDKPSSLRACSESPLL